MGAYVVRRRGLVLLAMLTAAAPGVALAQVIGRWGNWWNQEPFGRPAELPGEGVEISDAPSAHEPDGV
jgi:prolipoprotein diacylglyceryltransferase